MLGLRHSALGLRRHLAVSIRPETIGLLSVNAPTRPGFNRLRGTVAVGGFLGSMTRYRVQIGDISLQVNTGPKTRFEAGSEVCLEFADDAALGVPQNVAQQLARAT